ncbi:hypothetical protein BABINDRAFT_161393 [Babjeviella inositovora NRRL Y-12698]|uniref:Anaphase-promoting complex subunit CDC26 n=1 Tax=Babjeviella inositovora NRRL Y-12698 TaxID=984486 RepID=A0A1E3QQC3_9ASCO|nr:uncharacterized protein BABINDRAFT_161393 [Babjeviella inositovora NRRL Y-12698]ODQ79674.1 hypothetical protein BABINDRAFT_161393 [Babjeviella inositovora NRRL Y-12698]
MLRRPPTTIKLTPEDVLAYDDAKSAARVSTSSSFGSQKPNTVIDYDESPLSNATQDLLQELNYPKTKDERIGVSRP